MNIIQKVKENKGLLLNIGLIIIIILITIFNSCKRDNLKDKLEDQSKLTKALNDTIRVQKNKYNELEYSKKSIQYDHKRLEDENHILTDKQKMLLERVKQQDKNNKVINAAIIELKAEIRNITNKEPIEVTDSSLTFKDNTDSSFKYEIAINGVKPIDNKNQVLDIKNIELPNTQNIQFYWENDKKEGYPISFSVSNSNKYFKVHDIESYSIPNLDKKEIDPNFWQRLNKTTNTKGFKIFLFSTGFISGTYITYKVLN